MRTRHRIPTIFNLSMVDVLCCALGCVILLWLLNLREAKQRAEVAGQTSVELAKSQKLLSASEAQASALDQELRKTADKLGQETRRAESSEQSAATLQRELDKVGGLLAAKATEQDETAKDLTAARQAM